MVIALFSSARIFPRLTIKMNLLYIPGINDLVPTGLDGKANDTINSSVVKAMTLNMTT